MSNILEVVKDLCLNDHASLCEAEKTYGDSWKKRGGVGAFMMLARKWDRIENLTQEHDYDIFHAIGQYPDEAGVIDDIRDLRRYLLLVEAEMVQTGYILSGIEEEDDDATTIVPAEK
jgi:hypothetical protein